RRPVQHRSGAGRSGPSRARQTGKIFMKTPPRKMSPRKVSRLRQSKYLLRLYISRSTLKSKVAVENIQRVCEEHLEGRYDLEVIDIHDQAGLARDEQIIAVPT